MAAAAAACLCITATQQNRHAPLLCEARSEHRDMASDSAGLPLMQSGFHMCPFLRSVAKPTSFDFTARPGVKVPADAADGTKRAGADV